MENDSYFFIGVCDGHGDDGEQISNLVSNKLQNYIFDIKQNWLSKLFFHQICSFKIFLTN